MVMAAPALLMVA
ncbi:hypothetical protein YPPY66_0854, partial [Yersinia pestis PY-66]